MTLRSTIFALLITLAFVHGRNTPNGSSNNEIINTQKEGRTLEIPIIGTILLVTFQIAKLVISSALSLLEYKLTILSYVSWLIQDYFPVIVATGVVVGLCFIMSSYSSDPVYEIDQRLYQAARNLDQGIVTYGRRL